MSKAQPVAFCDPDTMSVEDLRDEVWFWRDNAAATLVQEIVKLRMLEEGGRRGVVRKRRSIQSVADLLEAALFGDVNATCFACGLPIRAGDACISDVEGGEMHAECPDSGRASTLKPGDKVFVDPDSIVWEGEGPKPDHLIAHACERLFTVDQLVRRVDEARAAIAGRRAI